MIISYFLYENIYKKDVIKIGFVAGLSGKYSNLGHSVLDGFNLAFSEIYYKIDDYKIQISIKDDKQKDEIAKRVIQDLKKENITLVVGNTTSSMTKTSLANLEDDMFLFSPSASSGDFSYKDDNFFRVQVAHSKERFKLLSKYLLKENISNLYLVYDAKNSSYTNNYVNNLKESLNTIVNVDDYIGKKTIDQEYQMILEDIKSKENLDGVIIVANSIDTSKLIQFLRLKGFDKQIIASGWAKNKNFLEDAGKAANGTIFLTSYDMDSENKTYQEFVKRFKERYNYEPSVFSAQGYETAKIIINILKKDSNLENFKKNLLRLKTFKGLQGDIIFDKYGDVQRESFIVKVKDDKFEKIEFH